MTITLSGLFKKFIFNKGEILIYSSSDWSFSSVDAREITDIEYNLSHAKERLKNGDKLFIVTENDELAHYSWVKFDEMDITEASKKIKLKEGEACIYDCYTNKKFRGQGLYPSMLKYLKGYFKEKGFNKVYIYVEANNIPSIKGIEKAGFKKEDSIKYLRILGVKL